MSSRRAGAITYRKAPSKWDGHNDRRLMDARREGMNWNTIANTHFPGQSANACRKRHERLMRDQRRDEWDTVKLETLAVQYDATRKEMWSILSERLNEKWDVIEAKCMEKGANQLTTLARTARRRIGRGRDGHSGGMSPYGQALSDDSGIAMDEAESVVGSIDLEDSITLVSPSQHHGDQGHGFPSAGHLYPTAQRTSYGVHRRGHSSGSSTSGHTPSTSHGHGGALSRNSISHYPTQHTAFPQYTTEYAGATHYIPSEPLHAMTSSATMAPVPGLAPAYNTRVTLPPATSMQQYPYSAYAPYDAVAAPVHAIRSPSSRSRRH